MSNPSQKPGNYQRKPSVLESELSGEYVLLDQQQGTYFGVQGVGFDIWKCLKEPKTEEQIVDELLSIYEVEKNQLIHDTHQFLEQLLKDQLISYDQWITSWTCPSAHKFLSTMTINTTKMANYIKYDYALYNKEHEKIAGNITSNICSSFAPEESLEQENISGKKITIK